MKRKLFLAIGEDWPDWAIYLIGIAGGYLAFEDTKEGEAFLIKYRQCDYDDSAIDELFGEYVEENNNNQMENAA